MRIFRGQAPTGTPTPLFSFCERVTATPTSPIHIRTVGPEGQKFGGGAPNTVLCGADLHAGWDLPSLVAPDIVQSTAAFTPGRPGRTCNKCAAQYLAAVSR